MRECVWIDTDGEGEKYKSLLPSETNISFGAVEAKKYIISGEKRYEECQKLENQGLNPLTDFVPIWYFYLVQGSLVRADVIVQSMNDKIENYLSFLQRIKKIVVMHGNCQILKLAEFLACEKKISKKFWVLRVPPLYLIKGNWVLNHRKVVHEADLFIYQRVSTQNNFGPIFSSEYVMTACKTSCQKICISNMYFTGYFPQDYNGGKVCDDKNLDYAWENNENLNEVIDNILDENFYTEEICMDNVEHSLNELRNKEKECDIKISDFIEENYKSKRLFYIKNHPTYTLYIEMVRRILKYLGQEEIEFSGREILEHNGYEIPIYPSVWKNLKLEFEIEGYNFDSRFEEGPFSIREWMECYIEKYFEKEIR